MICENCGKSFDGSYSSDRFCSLHCARAYSSKHVNRDNVREVPCSSCGKMITIKATSPIKNRKCKECMRRHMTCVICGKRKNDNGVCDNEFCQKHNYQHFRSLVKYFGFDKSKLGTDQVENEFNRVREEMIDLYWNQKLSSTDIAKIIGYPSNPTNITQKVFKAILDIPVRSVHDAVMENYFNGKLGGYEVNTPNYKHGWHTSWNGKEVYLRSSYEFSYAEYLDSKCIDYDVESLRIKYFDTQHEIFRCAIPDFYLIDTNTIVEVKSDYTLDRIEMKDKVAAYKSLGYNFKLILNGEEAEL